VPSEATVRRGYDAPIRHRSMNRADRMMFMRLLLVSAVLSILAFTVSYSLILDLQSRRGSA